MDTGPLPGDNGAARPEAVEPLADLERSGIALSACASILASGRLASIRVCANCPCEGGYRALYEVIPDTGRDETTGDVIVLRVYGPGQDRRPLRDPAPSDTGYRKD